MLLTNHADRIKVRLRKRFASTKAILSTLITAAPDQRNDSYEPITEAEQRRRDVQDVLILSRALTYSEPEPDRNAYAELKALRLIPVKTDLPDWVRTYEATAIDWVGVMDWITSYSEDLPNVGLQGATIDIPYDDYGGFSEESIIDLRYALKQGLDIGSENAAARARASAEFIDRVLWFGEPKKNIPGFLNNVNVTLQTSADLPNGGDWLNGATTADEIVEDYDAMVRYIPDTSDEGFPEETITVLLPSVLYTRLSGLTVPVGTGELSVIERFRQKHPGVRLEFVNRLNSADAAGTGPRAVTFVARKDVVLGVADPDVETRPPEARGLSIRIYATGKCGGVMVKHLGGMVYWDDL